MNKEMIMEKTSLPLGWEIKKLPEMSEDFDRKRVPITKSKRKPGNIPYYGASGIVDYVEGYLFDEDLLLVSEDGANLLARTYPIAFPISGKTWVNNHAHILKFEESTTQKFIELYLNSIKLDEFVSGMAQPKLNKTKLNSIPIPFPPLPQQKQIVAILDKAFAAIDTAKANAEQNLQNAKELFESYLQNVFEHKGDDWEEKTLEQIAEVFGRGKSKHRPRNDKKLFGGNYPFVQTGNIRNSEHYVTKYTQTYNETGLAQSKLWPKGTICITIAANIAETGILTFDACFPDSIIGIVADKKQANIDYVEYLLQYFKVNIQSLSQGSAQENINMGTFKDKLFPFPSIQEQQKIVKKLNTISAKTKKLKSIYTQKIADLEELKKSVLQKAFSGQLSEP